MSWFGNFLDYMIGARRTALTSPGFFGWYPAPISGGHGEIAARQAMAVSAVYAAVHAYTEGISAIDLGPCDGESDDYDPMKDHDLYPILHDQMNMEETSQQAMAYLVASLFLNGNAYAQVLRTSLTGSVAEIVPLDPSTVTPKRKNGRLVYHVEDEKNDLAAADVVHVALNYNRKLLCGESPLTFARTTVGIGLATDSFGLSYFTQGCTSRVMLEHPAALDEKQAREVVENFTAKNSGIENMNRVGIATGGLKVHLLTMPLDDSQFLESRRFTVNEIARWFNLPPSRIGGDRSSGTYANLQQDQMAFITHSLRPVCRMFEQEFNRKLLSPAERGTVAIRFDLDDLLDNLITAPADRQLDMQQEPANGAERET